MFVNRSSQPFFPLEPGYYQGRSQVCLRNIWLKIKNKDEGLSLDLRSNELHGSKLQVKTRMGSYSLNKMKKRFQKGQRDFQIFNTMKSSTFKLVLSNGSIELVNGCNKVCSERIIDIVGVKFKKISELNGIKPDFKYETSLRILSSVSPLNLSLRFSLSVLVLLAIGKALEKSEEIMGKSEQIVSDYGIELTISILFMAIIMKSFYLFPSINKGPITKGFNYSARNIRDICNAHISSFHISDNIITIYWGELVSRHHLNKFVSECFANIMEDIGKECKSQGIDLYFKKIQPYHKDHASLHNFNDTNPSCFVHSHIKLKGIPVITPKVWNLFIAKMVKENLINPEIGNAITKDFKKTFISGDS